MVSIPRARLVVVAATRRLLLLVVLVVMILVVLVVVVVTTRRSSFFRRFLVYYFLFSSEDGFMVMPHDHHRSSPVDRFQQRVLLSFLLLFLPFGECTTIPVLVLLVDATSPRASSCCWWVDCWCYHSSPSISRIIRPPAVLLVPHSCSASSSCFCHCIDRAQDSSC